MKIILKSVISIEKLAFHDLPFLTIYYGSESQPAGWENKWNGDSAVYWKGQWS